MAQKQIQDIVKGGGGGRTLGSIRTTYSREFGGIPPGKIKISDPLRPICGHFSIIIIVSSLQAAVARAYIVTSYPFPPTGPYITHA